MSRFHWRGSLALCFVFWSAGALGGDLRESNGSQTCAACKKVNAPASELEEQVRRIACDTGTLAQKIQQGEAVVPSRIYHFGKKEPLLENAAARNVPQEAWDKYIMGGKSRYELGQVRRGLYGTAGLDVNSFGGGVYSWLMEIQIKDECRASKHVATLANLHQDPRFREWAAPKRLGNTVVDCYKYAGGAEIKGFKDGSECEKIALEFIRDKDIRILQDHMLEKSFYIRDRNCISNIRATPDELIHILGEDTFLWSEYCGYHDSRILLEGIVVNALAEAKEVVSDDLFRQLRSSFAAESTKRNCLDAYMRCRKAGKLGDYRAFVTKNGSSFCDKAVALCI